MMRNPQMRLFAPWIGLFLVWGTAVFAGGWAADYGIHWDEDKLIQGIRWSIEHKTLLPHSFLYPSLLHMLSLGLLGIQGLSHLSIGASIPFVHTLREIAGSHTFLISARLMTVLLSSLAIFWVALAIWAWRKNPWEALLGAALLGLSWEVNYHSRWFTVDPLMMQFGALLILCLVQTQEVPERRQWRIVSAVVAGLAAGSKYTAGLCLLPILTLLFLQVNDGSFWKKAGFLTGIFFIVFLLSTPGFVLNWGQMSQDLLFQVHTYHTLGNDAYTVARGVPHLGLMLAYLGDTVFSWYTPVALFFSGVALIGAFDLIKKERGFAAVFFVFPFAYIALFSIQIVMIARNLLILIPFTAILAARGATILTRSLWSPLRPGFITLIATAMLGNGFWLFYSAWTIRVREHFSHAIPLAQYIVHHPDELFLLTQTAHRELMGLGHPPPTNVTEDYRQPSDFTIFNTAEARERFHGRWPANRPHTVETWFCPFEVNLNYYPTWLGNHRFVVMKTDKALNVLNPPLFPNRDPQATP
jgi:hypothetical protein